MKDDKLNIYFGIASLLGLIFNVGFIAFSIYNNKFTSDKEIFITLGSSVLILSIAFIIFVTHYSKYFKKLNKHYIERHEELESEYSKKYNELDSNYNIELKALADLPSKNSFLIERIKTHELILKSNAEYIHNILHNYRNTLFKIDESYSNLNSLSDEEIIESINIFERYLTTLTTNLQSYFTQLTDDKCSVTIKLIKDKKVKTCYRDPISYRSRKSSDRKINGDVFVYETTDNYAFHIISSNDYPATFYICDDMRKDKDYFNINKNWENLYYATAVVSISSGINKRGREILGFLCVDNFKGNLKQSAVEGFMSGVGDMLFNLFKKFDLIINFAKQKNIDDERVRFYTTW